MTVKEFKNVLYYFCNKWSQNECNLVFNGLNFDLTKWKFSLGEHMWNKWTNACEHHGGSLYCITWYILEGMDNSCLEKIINRVEEIYGRETD